MKFIGTYQFAVTVTGGVASTVLVPIVYAVTVLIMDQHTRIGLRHVSYLVTFAVVVTVLAVKSDEQRAVADELPRLLRQPAPCLPTAPQRRWRAWISA